jgi:Protein of unknown function (DUF3293)
MLMRPLPGAGPGGLAGRRTVSARTLSAYRNTHYEAGGVAITIGRRAAAMDRLLASYGAREAAFITAYNPFSHLMPSGWNRRMQAHLARALRRQPILPAEGSWRRWSESHVLAIGDVRQAWRLGRVFRQNAIVIVRVGRPARLLTVR